MLNLKSLKKIDDLFRLFDGTSFWNFPKLQKHKSDFRLIDVLLRKVDVSDEGTPFNYKVRVDFLFRKHCRRAISLTIGRGD